MLSCRRRIQGMPRSAHRRLPGPLHSGLPADHGSPSRPFRSFRSSLPRRPPLKMRRDVRLRATWQQLSNSCPESTRLCRWVSGNRRKNFSPNRPPAMSLIHSAAALVYSALALAETFVLLAVVFGLFCWLHEQYLGFARIRRRRGPAKVRASSLTAIVAAV